MVPLLPPALKILNKYEGCYNDGQLMPIITNQKLNCYLKEIADICGIEKNLTFHLARHTTATTPRMNTPRSLPTICPDARGAARATYRRFFPVPQ